MGKPQDVPKLTAEDMASDEKNAERAKQRKYAMEEIQSDWALKNGQQRITGMFTCGKCKGTKTTYFQMQTRSSDEPMTTFRRWDGEQADVLLPEQEAPGQ